MNIYEKDQSMTHGQGVSNFFKKMFRWGGYCTKQEYKHGFIFTLYYAFFMFFISLLTVFIYLTWFDSFDFSNRYSRAVPWVFILLLLIIVLGVIPVSIASISLRIRRYRSAGIAQNWIILMILVPWFLQIFIPYVALAVFICDIIVCFCRPSIFHKGHTYSYFAVLSNNYNNPIGKNDYSDQQSSSSTAEDASTGLNPALQTALQENGAVSDSASPANSTPSDQDTQSTPFSRDLSDDQLS